MARLCAFALCALSCVAFQATPRRSLRRAPPLRATDDESDDEAEAEFNIIDDNAGGYVLFQEFIVWALSKGLDLDDDDDPDLDDDDLELS